VRAGVICPGGRPRAGRTRTRGQQARARATQVAGQPTQRYTLQTPGRRAPQDVAAGVLSLSAPIGA
jgi:hypothetical protein